MRPRAPMLLAPMNPGQACRDGHTCSAPPSRRANGIARGDRSGNMSSALRPTARRPSIPSRSNTPSPAQQAQCVPGTYGPCSDAGQKLKSGRVGLYAGFSRGCTGMSRGVRRTGWAPRERWNFAVLAGSRCVGVRPDVRSSFPIYHGTIYDIVDKAFDEHYGFLAAHNVSRRMATSISEHQSLRK